MRTLTKPSTRPTEHLRQTLAALARLLDDAMNHIPAVESELQEQAILAAQEAASAIEQDAAERVKSAVDEAERRTRDRVTEELQARFSQEMASALEGAHAQLDQAAAQWRLERDQLVADCERANILLDQARSEHSRTIVENDEAAAIALERQIATAVDRVRAELSFERDRAIQSANEREADHRQTVEKLQRELSGALEQARIAAASVQTAPLHVETSDIDIGSIHAEVARVEGLIQATSELIEDPEAELSVVIRKNAERAELESYLRGVRFSIPGTE